MVAGNVEIVVLLHKLRVICGTVAKIACVNDEINIFTLGAVLNYLELRIESTGKTSRAVVKIGKKREFHDYLPKVSNLRYYCTSYTAVCQYGSFNSSCGIDIKSLIGTFFKNHLKIAFVCGIIKDGFELPQGSKNLTGGRKYD